MHYCYILRWKNSTDNKIYIDLHLGLGLGS